jgi:hypothetical protein
MTSGLGKSNNTKKQLDKFAAFQDSQKQGEHTSQRLQSWPTWNEMKKERGV